MEIDDAAQRRGSASTRHGQARETWRPTWPARLAAVLGAGFAMSFAGALSIAMVSGRSDIRLTSAIFMTLVFVVGSAVCLRAAFFLSLQIRGEDLVARNIFSTRRCALTQVTGVGAGYSGIVIQTEAGQFVASAVQKSNLSKWLHQTSRADMVAKEIMSEVARVKAASE